MVILRIRTSLPNRYKAFSANQNKAEVTPFQALVAFSKWQKLSLSQRDLVQNLSGENESRILQDKDVMFNFQL